MLRTLPLPLLLSMIFISSCRNLYDAPRPYKVFAKPADYFEKLVNPPKDKGEPTLKLENSDYPIEISLFNDRTFHYHLAKLGDGQGEWKYQDGHLELYAERKLFVMRMEVHSVSEDSSNPDIALEFSDRFGPKFLPLQTK